MGSAQQDSEKKTAQEVELEPVTATLMVAEIEESLKQVARQHGSRKCRHKVFLAEG